MGVCMGVCACICALCVCHVHAHTHEPDCGCDTPARVCACMYCFVCYMSQSMYWQLDLLTPFWERTIRAQRSLCVVVCCGGVCLWCGGGVWVYGGCMGVWWCARFRPGCGGGV